MLRRNRQGGTVSSDSAAIRRGGVCPLRHTSPDSAPARNLASGASRPRRARAISRVPSANTPTNKSTNAITNHLPRHLPNHQHANAPIHPLPNLPLSRLRTHFPLSSASLSALSQSLPLPCCPSARPSLACLSRTTAPPSLTRPPVAARHAEPTPPHPDFSLDPLRDRDPIAGPCDAWPGSVDAPWRSRASAKQKKAANADTMCRHLRKQYNPTRGAG
jgi:hypothetical protein